MEKFHNACQNIVDNKNVKTLNWAVNYAYHGLNVTDKHEAKIQALYILNNMIHWRGDIAKKTRQILKEVNK